MDTDRDETRTKRPVLKKRPDIMTASAMAFFAAALLVFIVDGAITKRRTAENPADNSSAVSESSRETLSVPVIPAAGSTSPTVTSFSPETSVKAVPAVVSVTAKKTAVSKTSSETSAPKTSAAKKTSAPVTTQTSATTAQTSTTASETETVPPETTVSETTAVSTVSTTVPTTSVTTTTVLTVSFPADINKLTYEELLTVPGLGEKMAGDIVYLRERLGLITNMEQLLELYGIGDEKLGQLKAYLFVNDDDYRPITESTVITTVSIITETEPPAPVRKPVNINTADENEIAECLLLSYEKAAAIVSIREMIKGFTSPDELRLVSCLTEKDLSAISDYIII